MSTDKGAEAYPGYPQQAPPAAYGSPAYGQPAAPAYGQPAYGAPAYPPQSQPGYPPQQPGYPPQSQPGYPPQSQPGYPPQQGYPPSPYGQSPAPGQYYPQATPQPQVIIHQQAAQPHKKDSKGDDLCFG
ncbi:hypothetical protein BG004_007437, partial [Podila humilis]